VETRIEGEATPIAKIGIERISRKTDLVPPEKMRYILLESAKARLLNEVRTFVCTDCWGFTQMIRIKDLPERLACPKCGSDRVGVSSRSEDELRSVAEKRGDGLLESEEKLVGHLRATADLMASYGRSAAVVLSGRRVRVSDAAEVLGEEGRVSDKLFSLVIEAERNALKRRFW
jgi:ATP-dependent Lhr-like helicase